MYSKSTVLGKPSPLQEHLPLVSEVSGNLPMRNLADTLRSELIIGNPWLAIPFKYGGYDVDLFKFYRRKGSSFGGDKQGREPENACGRVSEYIRVEVGA